MKLKDENGKWTKMSKITGTIAALITTVSIIGGGIYKVADANAWDDELLASNESTVELIKELTKNQKKRNCDYIADRLNELKAKERYGQMTEYDYIRKDQLETELEQEC